MRLVCWAFGPPGTAGLLSRRGVDASELSMMELVISGVVSLQDEGKCTRGDLALQFVVLV